MSLRRKSLDLGELIMIKKGDIVRAVGHLIRKNGTIQRGKPGVVDEA